MKKHMRSNKDKFVYIRGNRNKGEVVLNYLYQLGGIFKGSINLEDGKNEKNFYYLEECTDGKKFINCCPIDSQTGRLLSSLNEETYIEDSMFVIKQKKSIKLFSVDVFPSREAAEENIKNRQHLNIEDFEIIKLDFNYGK